MSDKVDLILNYMDLYKEAIEIASLDGDDIIND